MEKYLIVFLFAKFKANKQTPNDPHKEVKSEPEMWFFWAVVVHVPVLVASVRSLIISLGQFYKGLLFSWNDQDCWLTSFVYHLSRFSVFSFGWNKYIVNITQALLQS